MTCAARERSISSCIDLYCPCTSGKAICTAMRWVEHETKNTRQKNIKPYNDRTFGWPYTMPSKGFWYSDQIDYLEVIRVLNNLINIKRSNWISKINYFKKKIMVHDYMNTKLKKYTDDLIAQ